MPGPPDRFGKWFGDLPYRPVLKQHEYFGQLGRKVQRDPCLKMRVCLGKYLGKCLGTCLGNALGIDLKCLGNALEMS